MGTKNGRKNANKICRCWAFALDDSTAPLPHLPTLRSCYCLPSASRICSTSNWVSLGAGEGTGGGGVSVSFVGPC